MLYPESLKEVLLPMQCLSRSRLKSLAGHLFFVDTALRVSELVTCSNRSSIEPFRQSFLGKQLPQLLTMSFEGGMLGDNSNEPNKSLYQGFKKRINL